MAGKLLGRGKCALCEITHGWNPMGSRSWKQACAASDAKLTLLHRDEATDEQLAATTGLPSIIHRHGDQWDEVLSNADVAQYVGTPVQFLERLEKWAP